MVSDQVVVRSKNMTPLLATCGHLMARVLFLLNLQNLICLEQKSLYLSKKMRRFLSKYRIEEIVKKYSDFVPFPIFVTSEEDKKEKKTKRKKKNR